MICLDAGHGVGNRSAAVYDPGIVNEAKGAGEAVWTYRYCATLAHHFGKLGIGVVHTRPTPDTPAPLRARVALARSIPAALLLSVHFNGDGTPGVSAPDGRLKGFEALYASDESYAFALAITGAVQAHIPTRKITYRGNLYVLRYTPSVLLEVGFLDDPEDYELIIQSEFQNKFCRSVALAVTGILNPAGGAG